MAQDKEVVVDEQEMNPNDPEVRAARERAIAYADRVMAGEQPWLDEEDPTAPKNDDVGEDGGADEEPVPVDANLDTVPAKDDVE